MAITSLDGLVAAMPGQYFTNLKTVTPQAASAWTVLTRKPGMPGAASVPSPGTNGQIPTNVSGAGYWPFTNPTGGNKTYLSRFSANAAITGVLFIYDRLWENSGLSATTVGAQTFTQPALTRFTDGVGVEAWWESYGTIGSGSTAPTISYTNTTNTSGRTATCVYTASTTVDRTMPFTLQAGDFGIKSIQSFNNVGSHTSGSFGLVLRKRLTQVVISSINTGDSLDPFELGMLEVPDDACLEFIWFSSATTANTITYEYGLVQG